MATLKLAVRFVQITSTLNVAIRRGRAIHIVPWADVILAKAQDKHISILTNDGAYTGRSSLNDVVRTLARLGLVRIHRGIAVNSQRVRKLRRYGPHHLTIVLDGDIEVKVGRQFQRQARLRFGVRPGPRFGLRPTAETTKLKGERQR